MTHEVKAQGGLEGNPLRMMFYSCLNLLMETHMETHVRQLEWTYIVIHTPQNLLAVKI